MTALKRNWPELLVGLGIVVCGLIIGWQASGLKVSPAYARVGPAAFLWLSSGLLILCGAIVAFRAHKAPVEEGSELSGPLIILAGLAASVILMERIGFILSATILFLLTARGLGSRSPVRDVIIGFIMCMLAYLLFAKGLGLRLPTGGLHP